MSDRMGPLDGVTTEELIVELSRRATVGVFVALVGNATAEEALSRMGEPLGPQSVPTISRLISRHDREVLEDMHRCAFRALMLQVDIFKAAYGACPRCYGESA